MNANIVDLADKSIDIEERKLALERLKLGLENATLDLERKKAFWTGIGVILPLIGILITVILSSINQSRLEKFQVEIEATKLVMGNDFTTPHDRLDVVKDLFRRRLANDFGRDFEMKFVAGDRDLVDHKELVRLLADHLKDRETVFRLWRTMFAGDERLKELEADHFPE
jgi:hypothetical protein